MDIYLKNEKLNESFHFPVNPIDKLTDKKARRYETLDIVDFGEVDIQKKGKSILPISFSTLLPGKYYPFCRYTDIPDAKDTVEKIKNWMDQAEPHRLIITDHDYNELVTISDFQVDDIAGEVGDKYISITFRPYRELKIEVLPSPKKTTTQTKSLNDRSNTQIKSKSYIVVKGDTLYKIAKRFYGNGSKWNKIYSANKKVIGSTPNIIRPGQKLVIP